jgi:NADPH:quinone reductase-like Zn-dependent oxidoreductase
MRPLRIAELLPIAAEYPLADAAKAQQRMSAGHVLGKVVLQIR